MKRLLSLLVLCLLATGIIGVLTVGAMQVAPSLELRVLAVIGAVLAGYVLVQPVLNRLARTLA